MGRRQELVATYARELIEKCRMEPDMALLEKVAIGCGPAIYDPQAAVVADTQNCELMSIKQNLLVRKLALNDGPHLMAAIRDVLDTYKAEGTAKYRAVVYYMLVKHFRREGQYI